MGFGGLADAEERLSFWSDKKMNLAGKGTREGKWAEGALIYCLFENVRLGL